MWRDTWSNALGNGVEAAISATLALRVARSVVPVDRAPGGARRPVPAVDPFAEARRALPRGPAADALPSEGELA